MIYFIKFLYNTFILPPGIIIFLLILYAVYLFKKKNKAYKGVAVFAVLLYIGSISLIGDFAIHVLEGKFTPPSSINGDVIVMLGGGALLDTPGLNGKGNLSGSSAGRLVTCIELYKRLHIPIIISGGQVYSFTGNEAEISKRILINLGVKESDIILDNKSLNTEQNAINTAILLKEHGFIRPILITSAFHMERAVMQFKRDNVEVTPYPCDYKTNIHKSITIEDFIPKSDAIDNLSIALKEYIGILQIYAFSK